jgi:hypothetical protein
VSERVLLQTPVERGHVMTITGHFFRCLSAGLIVAVTAAPCLSAPTVIAELGRAPLLGPNTTLSQLQVSIARNESRLSTAAALAGMSPAEYRAFRIATVTQRPDWVRIPRRLSAMTWYSGGQVRVTYDVEIPAATYGFEYDESGPGQRLRIYLPVACGNLSVLRERIRRVAVHKPPMAVSAIRPHAAAMPIATPTPAAVAQEPQSAPTPLASALPTAAPTVYLGTGPHRGFFPFLATLFGFILVGGGGSHSGGGNGGGGGGGGGCSCTKDPR